MDFLRSCLNWWISLRYYFSLFLYYSSIFFFLLRSSLISSVRIWSSVLSLPLTYSCYWILLFINYIILSLFYSSFSRLRTCSSSSSEVIIPLLISYSFKYLFYSSKKIIFYSYYSLSCYIYISLSIIFFSSSLIVYLYFSISGFVSGSLIYEDI